MNGIGRLLLVLGAVALAYWQFGGSFHNAMTDVGQQMRHAGTFGMKLDPNEVSNNVEDRRGEHRGDIHIPGGDLPTQAGRNDIPQQHEERREDGRVIVGCWDGNQMLPPSHCGGGGIATTGQAGDGSEMRSSSSIGQRNGVGFEPRNVFGFPRWRW